MMNKYSAIKKSNCETTLGDIDLLYTKDYSHANFDNDFFGSTDKCLGLLTILEKTGYPLSLDDLNSKLINEVTVSQERYTIDFFKIYTYTVTYPDGQYSFTITLDVDYSYFITLYGDDTFSGEYRNSKEIAKLLPQGLTADIHFGAFYNSVILYAIKELYDARLFILNNIDIKLNSNSINFTIYSNIPSNINDYVFPPKVNTLDDEIKQTYKIKNKTLITYKTNIVCFNNYNSFGYFYLSKLNDDINYDSFGIPDLETLEIKGDYTGEIPTIEERDNLKDLLTAGLLDMDVSSINEYKNYYTDDGIIAYQNDADDVSIILYDKFQDEIKIEDQTSFTNIDLTNIDPSLTAFSLLDEDNYTFITQINNIVTNFSTINKILIYSFGNKVYSFLRDFNTIVPTIKPSVYIEGLSNVTKNFISFDSHFLVSKYYIVNIYQDEIINEKVKFDTMLDNIQSNDLYDVKEESMCPIHTPCSYKFLIRS